MLLEIQLEPSLKLKEHWLSAAATLVLRRLVAEHPQVTAEDLQDLGDSRHGFQFPQHIQAKALHL